MQKSGDIRVLIEGYFFSGIRIRPGDDENAVEKAKKNAVSQAPTCSTAKAKIRSLHIGL